MTTLGRYTVKIDAPDTLEIGPWYLRAEAFIHARLHSQRHPGKSFLVLWRKTPTSRAVTILVYRDGRGHAPPNAAPSVVDPEDWHDAEGGEG